tara:strand:+ start:225 stop:716 length:492 start_codon:yes stop_codon:yes gene_type:complete
MNKCIICNTSFQRKCDLKRHELSQKHKKNLENINSNSKDNKLISNFISETNDVNNNIKYYCKFCNKQYIKKFFYDKHLLSQKHIKNIQICNEIDYRIPVINKDTRIVKYGKNAPLKSKLDTFLEKNTNYEIYIKDKVKNYNSFLLKLKTELINIIQLIDKEIH